MIVNQPKIYDEVHRGHFRSVALRTGQWQTQRAVHRWESEGNAEHASRVPTESN